MAPNRFVSAVQRSASAMELSRRLVLSVICVFFLFPFLTILWRAGGWQLSFSREIIEVFAVTIVQGLASAFVALIFGVIGGLGLLWASSILSLRANTWLERVAFLPNAAPVIILLLAVLKLFPWARGLSGVVFVHALVNVGLVSVAFAHLVRAKVGGFAELAWIEGSSGWMFFRRGLWPLLRGDLGLLFLFLFAVCFSSFAIPLVIGGSRATTVEVLIYQKMRMSSDWSATLGLAAFQMVAVFLLSALIHGKSASLTFRSSATPLLSWPMGLGVAFFPAFVMLVGLVDGLASGFRQLSGLTALTDQLLTLLLGSLIVSFGTGLLVLLILFLLAFARPVTWLDRVLLGYSAPSSVLVGFGLLIAWRSFGYATYLKIIIGIALIAVPTLYRYQWSAVLKALDAQCVTARTLGAAPLLIWTRIVIPQTVRSACFLSGLAALWAWGDFALSSVVAERTMTVPMAIYGLLESYRFDAATALAWILVCGGLSTFAVFVGAGYVFDQKS